MRRFFESQKSIPLLFAILTILAYGLLLPFTGFYWDDWVFAWIVKFLGPAEFFPAFVRVRPFLSPIFYITTSLIPTVPIYWQIFALIIRFLAGLSAWFALNRVWTNLKLQTLVVSLLLLVFPGYSQHWVALTHINQEWIAFIFYLLSFGFTARALRNPQKFRLYTVFALLLFAAGVFPTEYFLGMEPLRLLFIWVIISEETAGLMDRLSRTLQKWLPYLLIWLGYLAWLAYYYRFGVYSSYDIEIVKEPFSAFGLMLALAEAMWNMGILAWVQILALVAKTISTPTSLLTLILIGAALILVLPSLRKLGKEQVISKATPVHFILIGLAGIVLGRVPSYAAGLPFRLQSSFDRFSISMMLGGCLFIVGLVEWLVKSQRAKVYVFALLIALGTGQQFFNGNIFRRDWERQQEIFWQLKWRIPSLEPNTVILTDEIAVDYESDISLTGPINWMYAPEYKRGDLPYLLLYIDSRLGGTLPSLEPDTAIRFDFRTVTFHGNTSQAIMVYIPENGCLRVLNPALGDADLYERKFRFARSAIHLSNTSLIGMDEIPAPDFLPKPRQTWCYYHAKAELARQFRDWDRVLALQQEASLKGFAPADPVEWLPFVEANAMEAEFDEAERLSKEALKGDQQVRAGVCNVWRRVQAQGPVGGEAESRILHMLETFQCAQ